MTEPGFSSRARSPAGLAAALRRRLSCPRRPSLCRGLGPCCSALLQPLRPTRAAPWLPAVPRPPLWRPACLPSAWQLRKPAPAPLQRSTVASCPPRLVYPPPDRTGFNTHRDTRMHPGEVADGCPKQLPPCADLAQGRPDPTTLSALHLSPPTRQDSWASVPWAWHRSGSRPH